MAKNKKKDQLVLGSARARIAQGQQGQGQAATQSPRARTVIPEMTERSVAESLGIHPLETRSGLSHPEEHRRAVLALGLADRGISQSPEDYIAARRASMASDATRRADSLRASMAARGQDKQALANIQRRKEMSRDLRASGGTVDGLLTMREGAPAELLKRREELAAAASESQSQRAFDAASQQAEFGEAENVREQERRMARLRHKYDIDIQDAKSADEAEAAQARYAHEVSMLQNKPFTVAPGHAYGVGSSIEGTVAPLPVQPHPDTVPVADARHAQNLELAQAQAAARGGGGVNPKGPLAGASSGPDQATGTVLESIRPPSVPANARADVAAGTGELLWVDLEGKVYNASGKLLGRQQ